SRLLVPESTSLCLIFFILKLQVVSYKDSLILVNSLKTSNALRDFVRSDGHTPLRRTGRDTEIGRLLAVGLPPDSGRSRRAVFDGDFKDAREVEGAY
ncbi:hypothetical protein BJ742DRAFT_866626, partial [Cladochytrium replicatum]